MVFPLDTDRSSSFPKARRTSRIGCHPIVKVDLHLLIEPSHNRFWSATYVGLLRKTRSRLIRRYFCTGRVWKFRVSVCENMSTDFRLAILLPILNSRTIERVRIEYYSCNLSIENNYCWLRVIDVCNRGDDIDYHMARHGMLFSARKLQCCIWFKTRTPWLY